MDTPNLDAFDVFGTRKVLNPTEEAWHREKQRRSMDVIRVKNPDTADFRFEWDKRWYLVPASGTADLLRYLAVTYVRNKAVDTINKMNDKLHDKDIEERRSKGLPEFQSKYDENKETYQSSRYPKTDDKTLLTKLYSEYWVGLVSEFGTDAPPTAADEPRTGADMTPMELKIIRELESRRVDMNERAPIKEEPVFKQKFEKEKEELVNEVTVEDARPEAKNKNK